MGEAPEKAPRQAARRTTSGQRQRAVCGGGVGWMLSATTATTPTRSEGGRAHQTSGIKGRGVCRMRGSRLSFVRIRLLLVVSRLFSPSHHRPPPPAQCPRQRSAPPNSQTAPQESQRSANAARPVCLVQSVAGMALSLARDKQQ